MMNYTCKDVVLVDVLFSDGTGIKKRPALIISNDKYHKSRQEVIIAAITSNIHRVLCGDTKIDGWKEAGLIFPSLVTGIIQTLKCKMINRRLGRLSENDFLKTRENFKKILWV